MHSRPPALSEMVASDFDRVAALYEELQAPLSDLVSRRLVKLAGVRSGQRVLDIGTGTGPAALAAARIVGENGSVTGIDVSKGMLAIARKKASSGGLTNVRFERMSAASMSFDDGSFDVVISNLGIPTYLFREAISETFRVLKSGGVLCFAEFSGVSPAWVSLSRVLTRYNVRRAPPVLHARRRARKQMAEMASKFPLSSFSKTLKSAGFESPRTSLRSFTVPQPPSDIYLRYLVTREHLEYSAMPEDAKKRFDGEMLRRLEALRRRSDGRLKRQVGLWAAEKP